jgi:hypothetical protein
VTPIPVPILTTTTTLACPTGTPAATVSIASASDDQVSGDWALTLTGTVTNTLSTSIQVLSVTVQVDDGSESALPPSQLLFPAGDAISTLAPGQTTTVSNDYANETSTSQSSLGSASVSWSFADVANAICPSGLG